MALLCNKCKNEIKVRRFLTCHSCSKTYHIDCANVGKRFNLMTAENKNSWKCTECWSPNTNNERNSTPNENITQRKKYVVTVSTQNSFECLSDNSFNSTRETSESELNRSCPIIGRYNSEEMENLHRKINQLENKLQVAEHEIDNLILQNSTLQTKISEYENKIKKLTHICTPKTKKKPKQRQILNSTQTDIANQNDNTQSLTVNNNNEVIDSTGTQTQSNNYIHSPLDGADLTKTPIIVRNSLTTRKSCNNHFEIPYLKRVHIFADEQGRGMCKLLQRLLGNKYKVYSDIKPGASTDRVLEYMKSTCSDYGKQDFIVILTGENDRDTIKQSSYLYYYLSQMKNTNVILCEPRKNTHLDRGKINESFELIGTQFQHVNYADLRFSYLGVPRNYLKHASQNILQEIIRFEYRYKLTNRYTEMTSRLNYRKPDNDDRGISKRRMELKPTNQAENEIEQTFFRY